MAFVSAWHLASAKPQQFLVENVSSHKDFEIRILIGRNIGQNKY